MAVDTNKLPEIMQQHFATVRPEEVSARRTWANPGDVPPRQGEADDLLPFEQMRGTINQRIVVAQELLDDYFTDILADPALRQQVVDLHRTLNKLLAPAMPGTEHNGSATPPTQPRRPRAK